jgi:hypothetical protein
MARAHERHPTAIYFGTDTVADVDAVFPAASVQRIAIV